MKAIIGIVAAGLLLTACEKNELETKPEIEVKSVSSSEVPIGGNLMVTLEFRDKEGDVDDSVTIIRKRLNQRDIDAQPFARRFKIPVFPDKTNGEMDVSLSWAQFLTLQNSPLRVPGENRNEPDTLQLSFSVRDAEGNRSDTVTLDQDIIVIR